MWTRHLAALSASLAVLLSLAASLACAQTFKAGNVFVYRVGAGVDALLNETTVVFVDEYNALGERVGTVPMPNVNSPDSLYNLTATGTPAAEGRLTMSQDNRYLVVPGYAWPSNLGNPATSGAGQNSRVVARISRANGVEALTRLGGAAYDGIGIHTAASSDGSQFWVGGPAGTVGGVYITAAGAMAPTQLNANLDMGALQIAGGQLFGSAANPGVLGLYGVGTIGNGLPTTGSPAFTPLPGVGANSPTPSQFVLFDVNPNVAGLDTLYVAEAAPVSPMGVSKYTFNGATWARAGVASFGGGPVTGLAGYYQPGAGVVLYAANDTVLGRIFDNGALDWTHLSIPAIATAAKNTAFRGLAVSSLLVPDAPVIGPAFPGNNHATITFVPPPTITGRPNLSYVATCNPGNVSGQSSNGLPIVVSPLANGQSFMCSVVATNSAGASEPSASVSFTNTGGPSNCTLDVDGNHALEAQYDGLLMLRAMFGLTGSKVTGGAIGTGANRTNWDAIRLFLNGNCGTNFAP